MSAPISNNSNRLNAVFSNSATTSTTLSTTTPSTSSIKTQDSMYTWDNSLLSNLTITGTAKINSKIAFNAADVLNSRYAELLYAGLSALGGHLVNAQFGNAPYLNSQFSSYIKANNNVSSAATTYNSAVKNAADALNLVINDSSATNTQKNEAIATYNTAVATASTNYNSVVTTFNQNAPQNIAPIASSVAGLNAYYKSNLIPTAAKPYSLPTTLPSSFSTNTQVIITGTLPGSTTPAVPITTNPISVPTAYNFVPSVGDILNASYNGNLDPTQLLWKSYDIALGNVQNAASSYNAAIKTAADTANLSVGKSQSEITLAISLYNTAIANANQTYQAALDTFNSIAPSIVSQLLNSIPILNEYYKNNNIPNSSSPYVISTNLPTTFPNPTASSINDLSKAITPSLVTIPSVQVPTPSDVLSAELKGAPSTLGNGTWQTYLSQLKVVTLASDGYNSALLAATNTLNASSGGSADVTAYNTAISAAATVYSEAVDNFNKVASSLVAPLAATLPALNTYFANNKIPTAANPLVITLAGLPTSAPSITASSISNPTLPISTTANQLNLPSQIPSLSVLNVVFPNSAQAAAQLLTIVSGIFSKIQFKILMHSAAENPFNTTKDQTLPDAYIDAIPPEFFSSSKQDVLARTVGSAAIINGQGVATKILNSVVENGLYNAVLTKLLLTPSQKSLLTTGLNQLSQSVLATAATNAGTIAADLLKSLNINSVDQNSAATTVASAIGFGQSVLNAVNATDGNSISAQVSALFNSLGLSTDGLIDVTAALKIALTANAASFVSLSLNLPGILPQLLNNIEGVATAGSEANAISLILQNPLSLIALKMTLLNESQLQVAQGSTTTASAPSDASQRFAINDAVNNAAAALLASKEESITKSKFLQNLIDELGKQDTFDTSNIQGIGLKANTALDTELRVSGLDTPFTELSLAQLSSRLTTDTQSQISQSPAIQNSISAVLAQNPVTNRQFHDDLVNALQNNQAFASAEQANRFADFVTHQLAPATIKASAEPLKGIGAGDTLSISELYQQLTTDINARLAGVSSAIPNSADLASKLVALALGPNSFLTTFNENTTHLVHTGHARVLDEIHGVADAVATPTVPLYQTAAVVTNIVKEQVEGYMNPVRTADLRNADDSKDPSNYLKNISIRI